MRTFGTTLPGGHVLFVRDTAVDEAKNSRHRTVLVNEAVPPAHLVGLPKASRSLGYILMDYVLTLVERLVGKKLTIPHLLPVFDASGS